MKALFIGLGGIGQRHLRNLKELMGDQLEVLAFRRRNLPVVLDDKLHAVPGENLETLYQIKVFTELQDALDQKPEVAFICNPTSMHVPAAINLHYALHSKSNSFKRTNDKTTQMSQ